VRVDAKMFEGARKWRKDIATFRNPSEPAISRSVLDGAVIVALLCRMPNGPKGVSNLRRMGEVARRLAGRNDIIGRAIVRFGKFIDSNPGDSRLKSRLSALRAPFQPAMGLRDVLEVAQALQEEDLKFWFAGGWGIDVLLGSQSRNHLDLDIVVDDYSRDQTRVTRALSKLGYLRAEPRIGGVWMPSVVALSDWSGRRIELMEVDWRRFAANSGHATEEEGVISSDALRAIAFSEGVIGDQKLPCLSRKAQLLFHSDFILAEKQRRDLDVLKRLQS